MPRKASDLTVTDQFCGAGGSSIGATKAGARVRLAMNHWDRAIETHNTNFPDTDHDCTDVSASDPRRYYSTDILITSPECTEHTDANGKPRQSEQSDMFVPLTLDPAAERSRATMWDVWRFAEYHRYNGIIVENVVQARRWILWDAWWKAGELLGYAGRCVYLNSMHSHPTPQSRDRMYVIWWRKGNRAPDLDITPKAHCPVCATDVYAVQSWKKPSRPTGKYRTQYLYCCPRCSTVVEPYYFAAINALDLSLPAKRIGDRDVPLKPRTMARIAYGLEKYGRQPLYLHVAQGGGGRGHEMEGRVRGAAVDAALTQTGTNHYAVAAPPPWIVDTLRTDAGDDPNKVRSSLDPMSAQTTRLQHGVAFLTTAGSRETGPTGMTDPVGTMTGSERFAVVQGGKVMTLRNQVHGFLHSDVRDPMFAQVGCTQAALVQRSPFLIQYYGQMQASGAHEAIPTQPARETHGLVQFADLDSIAVDDLYFRMVSTPEIGRTMAFPGTYVVTGTERERVKQYGNAVTPPSMELLLGRLIESLHPEVDLRGVA